MSGWEAALYLEKGHLFLGQGFGATQARGGEAVFNTGMSGYQEIFSDPSYCDQIVVMTYPHLGNTGVNSLDPESKGLLLSGVVAREYCEHPSSWRAESTLSQYLERAGVPAISRVDTREITRLLRDEGAQRGVIFPLAEAAHNPVEHGKKLLERVPAMEGLELVSRVSTKAPYVFPSSESGSMGTAVVYDFGAKLNILRLLRDRGFRVEVVPFDYPYEETLAKRPTMVALSNGPGDPALVPNAVKEIQGLIGKVPLFAICMGHQLLARAVGAKTYKLKFGHHGVNHPVKDTATGRILITSQNHGFSVRAEDLKDRDILLSHVSLNDETVEGFQSGKMRFLSVQFHPEACPGPRDAGSLFDTFIKGFLK